MLSTYTSEGERRLRARLKAGGTTTTLVASAGQIPLDAWTHVAATYDGSVMRLFVNGVARGSVPKTGSLDADESAAVWIGANPNESYGPFRGLIDDVRVYGRALTEDDVAALVDERDTSSR